VRIDEHIHYVTAPVAGEVVTARARIGHAPLPVMFRLRPFRS
jgi:hypothetical protein